MPNGGVPINMVIHPHESDLVIYCYSGLLSIYQKDVWDAEGTEGKPLAQLSERECGALAWFLEYWISDKRKLAPGYNQRLENFKFSF